METFYLLHFCLFNYPGATVAYDILQLFPFTSEAKRMGIVVRDRTSRAIHFYLKGADTVMAGLVQYSPWMEDEAGNLAREGLRTLVVAHRQLTEDQYADFASRCVHFSISVVSTSIPFLCLNSLHLVLMAVVFTISDSCVLQGLLIG